MTRFTDPELQALQDAVAAAEARTSGEIVVAITRRSHPYPEAGLRGAIIGALVALAFAALVFRFYDGWGLGWLHEGWGVAALTLAAALAGLALTLAVPALGRALAGRRVMNAAVHRRALQAFAEEEVFATRARTGVLLFLSLHEHRIEVLADTGIAARVPAEAWGDLVAIVRAGIAGDRLPAALGEALDRCGNLLEESGLERDHDDADELPNRLRLYTA